MKDLCEVGNPQWVCDFWFEHPERIWIGLIVMAILFAVGIYIIKR